MAAAGCVVGAASSALAGTTKAMAATSSERKILIAYFSRTGNTRELASQIQQRVGGDLFELRTAHSYPKEYRATTDQAKREQEANFRPQLVTEPPNLSTYDTVFVGYPNWWGTLPMVFFSFFEKYNFAGMTLIPFSTHEGSHFGGSVTDMKRLCPNSRILDGIALRGGLNSTVKSDSARREVAEWLKKLGMTT
jgi:flavodoxin